ncbi:ATP-dependent DNA helicase RecQ-like [Mercenaria mercenaria]|uniref:ATP-dependent DNA helicase RecQ-like n=1 Tax=Mercenaria mercenaria TaxID=6596 RepID=UPI00234ED44A|nr:ATP-dependent DNA helicase RecQ-like [Mercenaria mercenaria]
MYFLYLPGSHRTTHLTSMKSLSSVSFIIDHPEKFLTDEMFALFRTASDDISHIVIDEAHIIQKWGANFRQQYSKLQKLRAVLPAAKVLALTGSAGKEKIKQIKSSVLMRNVLEIRAPLSRPNIKLSVKTRLSSFHVEESFKQVLNPVIQELKEDPDKFGKTVVYSDLKWCGFGYQECLRCYPDLRNKMAQYHAPCTESMRKDVMDGMSEGRIQLLFATEAYSMGTDIKDIRRIIHFGVPKSIERIYTTAYIQEVGRAGRDGKQAESVLFFNNNDIASNRRHIEAAVADYCKETGCRWEFLCKYFNCSTNLNPNKHDCCDNCSKSCTCYDCSDFDMEVLDSTEVNSEHNSFSQEKADMVFGTLIEYFKSVSYIQALHQQWPENFQKTTKSTLRKTGYLLILKI